MNRKRRSKSSEEVTLEIRDSGKDEKRYWNLRGNKEYSYNHEPDQNREDLRDEISIEFNLDENRKLTEEQKQTILDTLLRKPPERDENGEEKDRNRFNKLIILLILIALTGPVLALIALNSGC